MSEGLEEKKEQENMGLRERVSEGLEEKRAREDGVRRKGEGG